MSNSKEMRSSIHWQLLSGASAMALLATAYGTGEAQAADSDRPLLWIELGGQFEHVGGSQQLFVPPFMASIPAPLVSPVGIGKTLAWAYGADGKISFQPEGSDWIFSAGIRYGRAQGGKHVHQQTKPGQILVSAGPLGLLPFTPSNPKFADAKVSNSETHTIADFTVGRDVGLGMFGAGGTSVVNLGVRFAQFNSRSAATLGLDPSPIVYKYVPYFGGFTAPENAPHTFLGSIQSTRSFHGLGPTVSWDASAPFAGSPESSELTFDWGVNVAMLFGRQKTRVHHQTTEHYYRRVNLNPEHLTTTVYQFSTVHPRFRSVTVPNVGGFAGLSLKFPNAKVSIGYRVDFFFGAMDTGIDTRKSENRTFNGPYASISIGLGD